MQLCFFFFPPLLPSLSFFSSHFNFPGCFNNRGRDARSRAGIYNVVSCQGKVRQVVLTAIHQRGCRWLPCHQVPKLELLHSKQKLYLYLRWLVIGELISWLQKKEEKPDKYITKKMHLTWCNMHIIVEQMTSPLRAANQHDGLPCSGLSSCRGGYSIMNLSFTHGFHYKTRIFNYDKLQFI